MNMLLRLLWIYLRAKSQPRKGLLLPFRIQFVVLPTDLDVCRHMNNGKYLSIMDLGRVEMLIRSGLLDAIRSAGFSLTVEAETIRFRRSLKIFQRFTLETRVLGWDDKALIMEQRFLRASGPNTPWRLVAEGVVRTRLVSNGGGRPSTQFMRSFGSDCATSPMLPAWVEDWNRKQSQTYSESRGELANSRRDEELHS